MSCCYEGEYVWRCPKVEDCDSSKCIYCSRSCGQFSRASETPRTAPELSIKVWTPRSGLRDAPVTPAHSHCTNVPSLTSLSGYAFCTILSLTCMDSCSSVRQLRHDTMQPRDISCPTSPHLETWGFWGSRHLYSIIGISIIRHSLSDTQPGLRSSCSD
jgi:hypothetical protein